MPSPGSGLALGAHVGVPLPDGFGLAVFFATLASIVYLYARLCRRFPIMAWLGLGFLVGLFGGSYYGHTTTYVEREYDGDCVDRDD